MNLQYWQLKTFNEKLNAISAFLKHYWKPLFRANLFIAGPMLVIGLGFITFYFNVFYQQSKLDISDAFNLQLVMGLMASVFIGSILYFFSYMSLIAVTLEFIKIVEEVPQKINDLGFIFLRARQRILRLSLLVFVFSTLASIGLVFIMLFVGIIGVLLAFLGFLILPAMLLGVLMVYSYLWIIIPTYYYQQLDIMKSMAKGVELIRGKFWQTIGMFSGLSIILYVIMMGLIFPILLFFFGLTTNWFRIDDLSSIYQESNQDYMFYANLLFTMLSSFLSMFASIIIIVGGAIQYFTLLEDKENIYLFHQIENFNHLEPTT